MNYILVLQWAGPSIADYDALIKFEEALESSLTGGATVDGHDMGSDEMSP